MGIRMCTPKAIRCLRQGTPLSAMDGSCYEPILRKEADKLVNDVRRKKEGAGLKTGLDIRK